MANRAKEDEKNERIIRGLLKLPENRRCINCNSLGPQYVCTSFWTFVCTTCSGIHREFTHRVKSVSVAKFTSQDVGALRGGGNASAKEIYFKEWDAQRNSFPDGSNVERLRDFIKHVYVDRRYTGGRSLEKPPREKMGDAEDNENRRLDTYQGGSRSPPYEDTYERRLSDRPSPGGRSDDRNYRNTYDERRSPGYDSENRQHGDYRKSSGRTEIINDWRREDRFGNGKKVEDSRSSDGGSRPVGRSPDHQKDLDASSPPVVRPVRDILGENVSPLRVIEPPKNDGRSTDVSVHMQRTASSSSLASSNGNLAEVRVETSLIDFESVSEPPVAAAVSKTQNIAANMPTTQPSLASSDNWANFDAAPELKVSQAPSNANSLESVLSELSVPTAVPGSINASITGALGNMSAVSSANLLDTPVGNTLVPPFGTVAPGASSVSNSALFPPTVAPAATARPVSALPINGGQWPTLNPQQSSVFPASVSQSTAQPFSHVVGGASANQPWDSLVASNAHGAPAASVAQARSTAEASTTGIATQPSVEVKPSGRKELPENLFTMNYASFPMAVPGWHTGPPNGMGFTMQYNIPMAFLQSSKSTNPFDLGNDPPPVRTTMFPSMSPLQSALPNVAPSTGLLHPSSLGTPSPAWGPPQSSHPLAMSSQPPSFPSPMLPVSYMGQQVLPSMPPRPQGMGFGPEVSAFGTTNPNPQLTGLHSAAFPPNTFSSVGGNPFG